MVNFYLRSCLCRLVGVLLYRHKRNIQNQFSDLRSVSLNWLQLLIYGLGIIWIIVIFTNKDAYIFSGVAIFVILIGFFDVQQKTIFVSQAPNLAKAKAAPEDKKKYARSGLRNEAADEIHIQLMNFFIDKAYYRRKEISLHELAQELETHPNYISQIIHERAHKSFYDYVNTFRLNAFKQLVKNKKHKQFTLLALAYECGFNSKSY